MADEDIGLRISAQDESANAFRAAIANVDALQRHADALNKNIGGGALQRVTADLSRASVDLARQVDAGAGATRRFRRDTNETTRAVEGQERGMRRMGDTVSATFGRMISGAAVGAAIMNAFTRWGEVDAGMRRTQVSTGATRAEIERLIPTFRALMRETATPLEQITAGFERFRTAAGLSLTEAEQHFPAVVRSARVAGVSVEEMAEQFGAAMREQGLTAQEAARLFDMQIAAARRYRIDLGDLVREYPRLAEGAAVWGGRGAEGATRLLAYMAVLSREFGSVKRGSQELNGVLNAMIATADHASEQLNMAPEYLRELIRQAAAGNADALAQIIEAVRLAEANGRSLHRIFGGNVDSIRIFTALLRTNIAETVKGLEQAGEEGAAALKVIAQGAEADWIRLKSELGELGIQFASTAEKLSQAFGSENQTLVTQFTDKVRQLGSLFEGIRTTLDGGILTPAAREDIIKLGLAAASVNPLVRTLRQLAEARERLAKSGRERLAEQLDAERQQDTAPSAPAAAPAGPPPHQETEFETRLRRHMRGGLPRPAQDVPEPQPEPQPEPEAPPAPRPKRRRTLGGMMGPRGAAEPAPQEQEVEQHKEPFEARLSRQMRGGARPVEPQPQPREQIQPREQVQSQLQPQLLRQMRGSIDSLLRLPQPREQVQPPQPQPQPQPQRQPIQAGQAVRGSWFDELMRRYVLPDPNRDRDRRVGEQQLIERERSVATELDRLGTETESLTRGFQRMSYELDSTRSDSTARVIRASLGGGESGTGRGAAAGGGRGFAGGGRFGGWGWQGGAVAEAAGGYGGAGAGAPETGTPSGTGRGPGPGGGAGGAEAGPGAGPGEEPGPGRAGRPDVATPMGRAGPGAAPPPGPGAGQAATVPRGEREHIAQTKAAMADQLRREGVPEQNVEEASNLLAGQGLAESGLNPRATHDQGTGYGIYGARLGRRQQMLNWMRENNYPPNSLEGQSRYMAHEAMTGRDYGPTRRALMAASPETRSQASNVITRNFERPAVPGDRTGFANRAANVPAAQARREASLPPTTATDAGPEQREDQPQPRGAGREGEEQPTRQPRGGAVDRTEEAGFGTRFGRMNEVRGMVVHHTGGRGDASSVIGTFKQRGYPAHYVVDRQGVVHRTLPEGAQGRHMRRGTGPGEGLSNRNMEGVEVIARDDRDVLPAQRQAAARLIGERARRHGYDPKTDVFGHGEVNAHKQSTEGMSTVERIRRGELSTAPGPTRQAAAPARQPAGDPAALGLVNRQRPPEAAEPAEAAQPAWPRTLPQRGARPEPLAGQLDQEREQQQAPGEKPAEKPAGPAAEPAAAPGGAPGAGAGTDHLDQVREMRAELEKPITLQTRMDASDSQFRRSSMSREADRELRESRWNSYADIGSA